MLKRAEFLAELTEDKQAIAIAGSHGKTTTTAMLVWMLSKAESDQNSSWAACSINLLVMPMQLNRYFVIEADEYDNMFLGFIAFVAL